MSRRPEIRKTRRWRALGVLVALSLFATGCASAAIAGGVLVVGVVAAVLTSECEEGVGVTVWDPSTSHSVCDATVIASKGDKHVSFSPCFAGYLGEGEWTVTAERAGYVTAVGTVTVPHAHKCSEPIYHSVELTLRPERGMVPPGGYGPARPAGPEPYLPYPTQQPPAGAPPAGAEPPGPSAPPAPAPSPGASPAPTAPTAAPTTSVPTGAFPLAPETR